MITFNLIVNIISIIAFIITICQLVSTRKVIRNAVETAQNHIAEGMLISKVKESLKILSEIDGYIDESKMSLIVIRMRDIQGTLEEISAESKYDSIIDKENYKKLLFGYQGAIKDLSKNSSQPNNINFEIIKDIINDISMSLVKVDNYLKQNLYYGK